MDLELFSINAKIMLRTVICDLFSDNQTVDEVDNLISTTAVQSASRVFQVSWEILGDWDHAGVLLIPSGREQVTIIRGDLHGQKGSRYLGIEGYGSIKVRAYTKKGYVARARVILSVEGASNFHHQHPYGAAAF